MGARARDHPRLPQHGPLSGRGSAGIGHPPRRRRLPLRRQAALDRAGLVIAPGEIHALLGPNGAGKTTLLRVVAGLQRPQEGRAEVLGAPPTLSDRRRRGGVSFIGAHSQGFYVR